MNTENKQNGYLLLFRGCDWHKDLSPQQMQTVLNQFMGIFERLSAQGKIKSANPLAREGKIVSGKKGRFVADGPFAESKEAVGGYFLLAVDTMEEAVEIAKSFPTLDYGASVEVRPIAEVCPSMVEAGLADAPHAEPALA
jgi:hypothetical protein